MKMWARWRELAPPPDDPGARALLDTLFGNSPYLTDIALQDRVFMTDLWRDGPDAALAAKLNVAPSESDAPKPVAKKPAAKKGDDDGPDPKVMAGMLEA